MRYGNDLFRDHSSAWSLAKEGNPIQVLVSKTESGRRGNL